MKKYFQLNRLVILKTVVIAFSLIFSYAVTAQRPVPFMWTPRATSLEGQYCFESQKFGSIAMSKRAILTKKCATSHPTYVQYPKTAFADLIKKMSAVSDPAPAGVHVYFASYKKSLSLPFMSNTKNKELVLIFAPTQGLNEPDLGQYFVLGSKDKIPHPITADQKLQMVEYYQKEVNRPTAEGLSMTVEDSKENYYAGIISETRSVYYTLDHFYDFLVAEVDYQNSLGTTTPKIDNIRIYYSCYSSLGIGDNPWKYDRDAFKNRMYIMFELMQGNDIYFIESEPNFNVRLGATIKSYFEKTGQKWLGGDKGQLCPPNCPPGT